MLVVALAWVYLLATSVQNAFNDVVDITGLVFALFYVLTGLAGIVYYRRRIFSGARDAVILGVLPIASAAFLVWMVVKYLTAAPASQVWSMIGIIVSGLVMMVVSRFWLQVAVLRRAARERPGPDRLANAWLPDRPGWRGGWCAWSAAFVVRQRPPSIDNTAGRPRGSRSPPLPARAAAGHGRRPPVVGHDRARAKFG